MRPELRIRPLEESDASAVYEMRLRNRIFFRPYEPIRTDDDFTLEAQLQMIQTARKEREEDKSYVFGIFHGESEAFLGRISLTSVFRGPWQNVNLGYYIDQRWNGRGIATEAVRLTAGFAFAQAGLHRVQAAVMPRNAASCRVLEKNGFRVEGLAERYLKINGVWEDHRLYALTREDWERVRDHV